MAYRNPPSGGSYDNGGGIPLQQVKGWGNAPQGPGVGYGATPQGGRDYLTPSTPMEAYETAQAWGGVPPGQPHRGYAPKQAHGGGFVMDQPQRGSVQPQSTTGGPVEGQPQPGYAQSSRPTWYAPSNTSRGYAPSWAPAGGYVPRQPQPGYAPNRAHGGGFVMDQPQGGDIQPGAHEGTTPSFHPPQPYTSGLPHEQNLTPRHHIFREKGGIADSVPEPDDELRARKHQKGYRNLFNPHAQLRWKYPNSYQMPGLTYVSSNRHRHRDCMQRVYKGPDDDRYLSPIDGHLAKLVVQATDDLYGGGRNTTWRRTFIRNISPWYLRVANFPFNAVATDVSKWNDTDWGVVVVKWLPACCGLLFLLLLNPTGSVNQVRNYGWYDPLPYRFWGYAKVTRNPREGPIPIKNANPIAKRVLGPRYLNYLREPSGFTTIRVDEETINAPYLFIGYTTTQFDNNSREDMTNLHLIAEKAAREAGVPAFWVGSSCMPEPAEMEEDVYRISDVVRGAHSLVIVVGHSKLDPNPRTTRDMLKAWGRRIWTLPEALLSPEEHPIKVYTHGQVGSHWEISKKKFAAVVWDDPLISRQLMDHYSGNLMLSRLELVSIALRCLSGRHTTEYLKGDLSYVLMGLVRERPQVDFTDSAFQAFARLSMANDSDQLLERLICTLPKDPHSPWLTMNDFWNTNLWDIYPRCQIAGIGDDDTVILDGAYGAAIRWKAFAPVFYTTNYSWKRLFSRILIHISPFLFFIGIGILANSSTIFSPMLSMVGTVLLVVSLLTILVLPYLIQVTYMGKLWGTQAWLFGFEGYLDLATIESNIFGAYMGRLKWSPSGSSISQHTQNEYGECVGIDPTTDKEVRSRVERAKSNCYGEMRVFTLVDTYTLTVTMFEAVRPPIALLLCGHEGGMQRAIMCSYDWPTQTLYRESVLRMETPVLERMFRVNRFRFGFSRPMRDVRQ